ncbi:MAG: protein-tyrosine-phosphatase [Aureliella sp.]
MTGNQVTSKLAETIELIQTATTSVPSERLHLLQQAALDLRNRVGSATANALFVCTHNSRRSHFADLWFRVGLSLYGVDGIRSESCGTEVTECNPRTIASLKRSGFGCQEKSEAPNPRYSIATSDAERPFPFTAELFSKSFECPEVPRDNVVAFMCCDDADARCPTVPGAVARYALSYVDPKASDGTPAEAATYDERSQQIAAEMFCLAEACAKSQLM